jgi:hypothetical protein
MQVVFVFAVRVIDYVAIDFDQQVDRYLEGLVGVVVIDKKKGMVCFEVGTKARSARQGPEAFRNARFAADLAVASPVLNRVDCRAPGVVVASQPGHRDLPLYGLLHWLFRVVHTAKIGSAARAQKDEKSPTGGGQ